MKQKRHLHSEQLLPSHVIWWLVTNWKRRLNILNQVNQHFIILHSGTSVHFSKDTSFIRPRLLINIMYFLYRRISFIAMALYSNDVLTNEWLDNRLNQHISMESFYGSELFMAGGSSNGFICGTLLRKMCPKLAFHINLRQKRTLNH